MDIHDTFQEPTEKEKEMMEKLMLAFIFPNTPATTSENVAFNNAVVYQINHEKTLAARQIDQSTDIPSSLLNDISSMSIGHFSFSLKSSNKGSGLNRETICPYAYATLLRAGLLYKGISNCCCGGDLP